MTPEEWDNLPWWVAKAYIEGMEAEELVSYGSAPVSSPTAAAPPGGDQHTGTLVGSGVGEFATRGFREYTIGADGSLGRV